MIKIGIIGWRGLVGSVLINRLKNSFINKYSNFYLFSTKKIFFNYNIYNAFDIKLLYNMDIIISCQGSEYTKIILKKILLLNWKGYWIDASSYLRMYNECELILDPINKKSILNNIKKKKIFSGVNCTVSLMLILLKKLIKIDIIDWIANSSYQAVSGAGSYLINKLIKNIKNSNNLENDLIKIEKNNKINFFKENPLLFNAIPWIDKKVNFSQTKEEWKSQSEANKILKKNIKIDSNCVRISSLRCHSQYFILKLKKNINLNDFYYLLNNDFIKIIKNNEKYVNNLTPYNISGSLDIFVGRIKKSTFNNKIFTMFSIGDQLLWGAAEPLKRFLEILIQNLI
ncbi:aspartate-semialdehyde dehydrogenase [Candidatus Carsonella ruddii]|uniref:aspartate-semialdehyde dehydrogenase n=1 Tax=Candidatus Carsonella ruddii HC isolate Thao2000 TaxID=1202538 RepID=J3Z149_CARRU|nr:aspartate-semialdehyde dehydrogenase [Candidatus Carsonella ruddii]AFP83949.1 aspartate-semialdehyde dehydrogenase [Candidatus Carsonella ruddii HC isolate Thao2000]